MPQQPRDGFQLLAYIWVSCFVLQMAPSMGEVAERWWHCPTANCSKAEQFKRSEPIGICRVRSSFSADL